MTAAGEGRLGDRDRLLSVEQRLCADLQAARAGKATAAQRFKQLIGQVPTGIPAPDSNLGITQAGAEYHRAQETYSVALKRFTDFVLSGIVPDDFKS
jgi:hypothetical protein